MPKRPALTELRAPLRACAIEWRKLNAAGTTGGKTWREFFEDCHKRQ